MNQNRLTATILDLAILVLAACSVGTEEATVPDQTAGDLTRNVTEVATEEATKIPEELNDNTAEPPNQPAGEVCSDMNSGASLSYEDAVAIAEDSACTQEGELKENHFCNENTGTWWIDLEVEKPGCNPACVVDLNTKTAEINWRCTGALPPQEPVSR